MGSKIRRAGAECGCDVALQDQLEAQQVELVTVKKERNRLEGNHEMTKACLRCPQDSRLRWWSKNETFGNIERNEEEK